MSDRPEMTIPDLNEKGRDAAGNSTSFNRRLFIQLQAFTDCHDLKPVKDAAAEAGIRGAVYADVLDARGIAIVACDESPDYFAGPFRRLLTSAAFAKLTPRPELTMFGRTYSIGYEADLEHTLIKRPIERIMNPENPWAVWYPLRRSGAFEKLPAAEQKAILAEHGNIGMSFSAGGFGLDVRLDCRGLDRSDNDFVIGLLGKDLFPLSAMVQAMRKTRQTSEFLERLGPFFIGRMAWPSPAS